MSQVIEERATQSKELSKADKERALARWCIQGSPTEAQREYYRKHLMGTEETIFGKPVFEMDKREFAEYCVLCENLRYGDLPFGDCKKCRNKGWTAGLDEYGSEYQEECECMQYRRAEQQLVDSEYSTLLRKYTFEKYTIKEAWQRNALNRSKAWTRQRKYPLLYLGGKTGAGKTHLAVSAFHVRVQMGAHGKFVSWRTINREMKMNMSSPDYEEKMRALKYSPLLLIDDLFWAPKASIPSDEDLKMAKEILDARFYNDRPTIITSNIVANEITVLSEPIGGRIVEYSGGEDKFIINFSYDVQNQRFVREIEPLDDQDDPFTI